MAHLSHYTLLKVKVPDLELVNTFKDGDKVKVPNPALVNIFTFLHQF